MSRQLRARSTPYARASAVRTRASGYVTDSSDLEGAGPSGVIPQVRPRPASAVSGLERGSDGVVPPSRSRPASAVCDLEMYGSDEEIELTEMSEDLTFDDSDMDRTYLPPRQPVNLPGDQALSDSESDWESDLEMDEEDYVRMANSSMESVPDSDMPLRDRLAGHAQVNAPGTAAFKWRPKTDAFVRRGAFLG